MRFDIEEARKDGLYSIMVSHNDKEELWTVDAYKKSKIKDPIKFFNGINGYFEYVGPEKQQLIFESLCTIKRYFDEMLDPHRMHDKIKKELVTLYELITFEELKRWVNLYYPLSAPENVKTVYDDKKNDLTRRLTYLREEYLDLVVLSILLKPAILMFGEFIRRVDKSKFKERLAFSLLRYTSVANLEVFKRLEVFVKSKIQNEEERGTGKINKNSIVLEGLGYAELSDWLLSKAVVKKVALFEENCDESIIANVYHVIDKQIKGLDKTFGGAVRDKVVGNEGAENDKTAITELYKVKQKISDGRLAVMTVFLNNPENVAMHVDPTFCREKLDICTRAMFSNIKREISNHQIVLTQWVLSSAVPPRGILSLNKNVLMSAMSVAQALLWHWGLDELTLLMSAEPIITSSIAATASAPRLNKAYIEKFAELYPFYNKLTNSSVRNSNVALKSIDTLTTELIQNDWKVTIPKRFLNKLTIHPDSDMDNYVVSAEIRLWLADLILKINELKLA